MVAGAAAAPADTAHLAYLSDAYPIEGRARVFSVHALAVPLVGTLGIFAMARLASAAGTWRAAPAVLLLVGVAVAFALRQLPDPGPAADAGSVGTGELPVTLGAVAHRLGRLRSMVPLLAASTVLGFATVGLPLIISVYLERRWHQNLGHRGHVFFVIGLAAFVALPAAGVLGDRLWRRRPESVMLLTGAAMAAFGLLLGVGAALSSPGMIEVVWFCAGLGAAVLAVGTRVAVAAVSPPEMRSSAFGLFGGYGLLTGGVAGTMVLSAVSDATSPGLALGMLAPVLVAGGIVVALGGAAFRRDVELVVRDAREQTGAALGHHSSYALEVRHLDFAYGTRQVLFDVSLRVDDGEVAALLGTNGAGKSTLLRAVAGLDHPLAGAIRLWGRDTTYLEAEQILPLGVAMLPGGKMTFPSLTVAENLRVAGHRLRRQRARLRAATDEVMELFPVLAERRDQRAGTLSGGEQQMLALGRVLLTRPRLVLIDELTLGLAPMIVEGLLAIVRRINEEGSTVLLVEQSVNLALSLADHAVFLERGEVRFDGRTRDLLRRDDLLRPVFLASDSSAGDSSASDSRGSS
jgi:ABC-type branched-subunit amino acid transport system ATPase component